MADLKALTEAVEHSDLDNEAKARLREIGGVNRSV